MYPVRAKQAAVLLFSLLVFAALAVLAGLRAFAAPGSLTLGSVVVVGLYNLVAAVSLLVGAIVLLFARGRRVAATLFLLSFFMMVSFTSAPAAVTDNLPFEAIGNSASFLLVLFLQLLLLLFPKNHVAGLLRMLRARPLPTRGWLLHAYLLAILLTLLCASLFIPIYYDLDAQGLRVEVFITDLYYVLVAVGIFRTCAISYRLSSPRERQQLRVFIAGLALAFAPLVLLTILPGLLALVDPAIPIFPGQFGALAALLIPLSLGYAVLRYQILVGDQRIRQVVTGVCLAVGLATGGGLALLVVPAVSPRELAQPLLVLFLAALIPVNWRLARACTGWLFAWEPLPLTAAHAPGGGETSDLDALATQVTNQAVRTLGAGEACLFLLDEDAAYYTLLAPTLGGLDFADSLLQRLEIAASAPTRGIERDEPFIAKLEQARRPLLFATAGVRPHGHRVSPLRGGAMPIARRDEAAPLLAPIHFQGTLIAFLAISARKEAVPFGGPDLDLAQELVQQFAWRLHEARQEGIARRSMQLLSGLGSATALIPESSPQEVALRFCRTAAEALTVGVELWMYEQGAVSRTVQIPPLAPWSPQVGSDRSVPTSPFDWQPYYSEGGEVDARWCFAPLLQPPCPAFAWLPLKRYDRCVGGLLLTAPSRRFSQVEQEILALLADHCTLALLAAQEQERLRKASAQLTELTQMKKQVRLMALHDLRNYARQLRKLLPALARQEQDHQALGEALAFPRAPLLPAWQSSPPGQVYLSLVTGFQDAVQAALGNLALSADAFRTAQTPLPFRLERGLRETWAVFPSRVLIIARAAMLDLLCDTLSLACYRPIAACSETEALVVLGEILDERENPPDAILIDSAACSPTALSTILEQVARRCSHLARPPRVLVLAMGGHGGDETAAAELAGAKTLLRPSPFALIRELRSTW